MIGKFASTVVLAAVSAAWAPAAAAGPVDIDIRVGPPAPRYELVPTARAGYVWAPGYWNWGGNRYVWTRGAWVRERPGYVYTQPMWVNHDGRYHFYRGAWARGGDRDGDGIRNRDDRHPNNPYRR